MRRARQKTKIEIKLKLKVLSFVGIWLYIDYYRTYNVVGAYAICVYPCRRCASPSMLSRGACRTEEITGHLQWNNIIVLISLSQLRAIAYQWDAAPSVQCKRDCGV